MCSHLKSPKEHFSQDQQVETLHLASKFDQNHLSYDKTGLVLVC